MSQIVLTQYVQEPNILQPLVIDEFDWVQSNISGLTSAIGQGMLGSNFSGSPVVLNGLGLDSIKVFFAGSDYAYFPFWCYYPPNNEIYYFSGFTVLNPSLGEYFSINTSYPDPADPVLFSDSVARNVMQLNSLVISNSSTNSAFTFSQLVSLRGEWIYPGVGTGPTLLNSWSAGSGLAFKFNNMTQRVEMQGEALNPLTSMTTSDIFVLPPGYRPAQQRAFIAAAWDGVANNTLATIIITTSGNVHFFWNTSPPPAGSLNVWFDQISFTVTD